MTSEQVEAAGGNPAGDPLRLVTWLANHGAHRGRPLRAGDIVAMGSCTGLRFVKPSVGEGATHAVQSN